MPAPAAPRRVAVGEDAELRHEARAALLGIEAAATGLSRHRDLLSAEQIDELTHGLVAEIRRLRGLLDGRAVAQAKFDLRGAFLPVLTCARADGLDVRSSVPDGVEVVGIPDRAGQVLLALLTNAKIHAPGSPVEIRAIVANGEVSVYVEDRGPGIPASLQERVFERRMKAVGGDGSGLGLFIARQLMEEQDGSIDVEPERGGRHLGRVAIPAWAPAVACRCVNRPDIDGGRVMTHRVLIVDDHPLIAIGLQLELTARGWDVETTSGPTAAAVIDHARAFQPECVVLDIHLGSAVGSGVDLITPLRQTGARVVMLTGETERAILAACLEAGALGWIAKSAFLVEVVASIEDSVAGRSLIGRASREAMLDDLRVQRSSRRLTLSPFDRLTPREQRVLGALIDGMSAEGIAEADFVALTTIRSQIRSILQKLGVRSQLAAVAQANRAGWRPRSEQARPPVAARS